MSVWHELNCPQIATLVTTVDPSGSPNGSPKSWSIPINYDPPRLVLSVKHKSHTRENIDSTGVWVTHIPPQELAEKVLHTAKPLQRGKFELDDVGLPYNWIGDKTTGMIPVASDMPFAVCKMEERFEYEDHVLYVGLVLMHGGEVGNMLLHRGRNVFVKVGEDYAVTPY